MAGPVISDLARVVLRMTQHGVERVNTFHVKKADGPFDDASLLALCSDFMDWYQNQYRQTMASNIVLQDITATQYGGDSSLQRTLACTTNCGGTITQEPEPGNVTHTVSHRTTNIGRSARGRTYLPGMTTPMTSDDDLVTSARLVQLASAFATLLGILWPHFFDLSVFSRTHGVVRQITSFVLENVLDSMRRRLPKRGA